MRVSRSRTSSRAQWPMQRQITVLLKSRGAGKAARKNHHQIKAVTLAQVIFRKKTSLQGRFNSSFNSTPQTFLPLGISKFFRSQSRDTQQKAGLMQTPVSEDATTLTKISQYSLHYIWNWYDSQKTHLWCVIRLALEIVFPIAKQKFWVLSQLPSH